MTCEIAVANRLGIALAADSAVTFSDKDGQRTYASGANKILQLAGSKPIAAMIYNNASLETMPWEVLLKEYRSHLRDGEFRTVLEYKEDLVSFLNGNAALLPPSVRRQGSLPSYFKSVTTLLGWAQRLVSAALAEVSDQELRKEVWARAIRNIETELAGHEVCSCLDASDIPPEKHRAVQEIAPIFREFLQIDHPELVEIVDHEAIVSMAIEAAFKNWRNVAYGQDYTGVVIAGYGQDEFLPTCCSIRVYGFIGSKILWSDEQCAAIDLGVEASFIQPFAQRAMVETFTQGASPEVWKTVKDAYFEHAAQVCRDAAATAGCSIPEEIINSAVRERAGAFTKGWAYATFDAHMKPLKGVVSGLSVPELAEFAETLVMLESLKEKVTSRTQSVGGPIDVAVITKAEGLVWIKRKLYFQPELNQRYLLRLQHQHGGRYD